VNCHVFILNLSDIKMVIINISLILESGICFLKG
jgi:hypothetical protein